jgi:hypothetical protein
LHSAFESAPYGVRLSLAFPIVAFGRLLDHEALLVLCEGGLIETLVFALGTKAVALLDATLGLLVSAIQGPLGGRFVAIGLAARMVEETEKGVDFHCLADTRIPAMVECLLAAIAANATMRVRCKFLYAENFFVRHVPNGKCERGARDWRLALFFSSQERWCASLVTRVGDRI